MLRPSVDAPPEHDPAVLTNPRQRLDLWSGVLTSVFSYAGHEVRVTTVADPHHARVAFRVESELLATGHRTTLVHVDERACRFDQALDESRYAMRLDWSQGTINAIDEHDFVLTTSATTLEVVAGFSPGEELARGEFTPIEGDARAWWQRFWRSGAAIDFAGSTDPRAAELERRVVLSQYLTAVNCAGTTPPQETGLVTNSWHGKFHLEMHWWHAAHFATWGRPELLERGLDWYLSILDTARETAGRQRHTGARWPKQVGPDGRESPATLLDIRDNWAWDTAWGWDFPAMAMTATRIGRPDLAVDSLLMDTAKNQYLPTGHSPQIGSLLPIYLPANGGLLAAVSLMAAGWDGTDTDSPGFPRDGRWSVRHEGFTPWP